MNPELDGLIKMMIEAGIPLTDIENALGVQIRARVLVAEYVAEIFHSEICGELEFNCN